MDNQLAAIIVHDLKNALGALEGELRAMADDPSRERALVACDSCAGMRDKLIGFLTLYKASTQGLHAQTEAVNPQDFLTGLVRRQVLPRPGLRIDVDCADAPVLGFFDEHLVGLAIEAALQNAARFAASTITLACRQIDGDLAFIVADDGPGLGTQEDKPSTGLGMSLCAAIARAHRKGDRHGDVSLQNGARGGAEFQMRLP